MEKTLSTVLRAAINLTGADMGTLQVAFGTQLRLTASHGFQDEFLDFFEQVEGDGCACGTALLTGAPVLVEDVRVSAVFVGKPAYDVVMRAGVRAVTSVPIVADQRLLGVLSTHWRTAMAIGGPELERLRWVAREAAGILEGTASGLSLRAIEVLARG